MAKNVIVVGMPRSGTSLVAGIFARHGYFVAEDPDAELREGDHHNPHGYWEAATLTRLNAEVFAAVGYEEDNTWLGRKIERPEADAIADLPSLPEHVAWTEAYKRNEPWLWKDPRLCYTLAYWWPLVDDGNTGVVLTRRDPEATYRSFLRLKWRPAGPEGHVDVLARIDDHLSAAQRTIDRLGIPHVLVHYEEFAADPDGVARRLSTFLEVDLEPEQLGFTPALDRSTPRGRFATAVDHAVERLPPWTRRVGKKLVPRSLLSRLFPERELTP